MDSVDEKSLLQSISEFLGETATTTANVGAYTRPLGKRIDKFVGKDDEDEEDEEERGHLLHRNF